MILMFAIISHPLSERVINMNEEYVTRNEFSEFMKRTEAMIIANREETQANIARIEAKEEASEARCQAQIAEIRGEVKELRVTVQDMKETVKDMKSDMAEIKADIKSLRYNLIGWAIGFAAVVIAGIQVLLAVRGG